jgi:hypothetical protein
MTAAADSRGTSTLSSRPDGEQLAPGMTASPPIRASITRWCDLTGMGRSATYEALGRGDLRAVKVGTRTLIDVPHGLRWLESLPPARIRPHGARHTRNA